MRGGDVDAVHAAAAAYLMLLLQAVVLVRLMRLLLLHLKRSPTSSCSKTGVGVCARANKTVARDSTLFCICI
jgi:hypothetical protein